MENGKKSLVVVILAGLLMASAAQAASTTYTFQNGLDGYSGAQDTDLYGWYAPYRDCNSGGAGSFYIAQSGSEAQLHRSILRFDLSSSGLVASTVQSAKLTLFKTSSTDNFTFSIYAISDANAGWVAGTTGLHYAEGEVCWNYKAYSSGVPTYWAGSAGLSTPGTDYNATALGSLRYDGITNHEGAPLVLDLPGSLIQHWLTVANGGLLLMIDPGQPVSDSGFQSSESSAEAWRPTLEVTVTTYPPGTVHGTVVLGNYNDNGSSTVPVAVLVELRQGGNVIEARTMLDDTGQFTVDNVTNGTYDVAVKSYAHLKTVRTGVVVSSTNSDLGTFNLINGDTDGGNAVTPADLSIILANMDLIGD